MSIQNRIEEMYKDHEVKPYISPERDLAAWLLEAKPVPKRNMIRLEEGLLQGILSSSGVSILVPLQLRRPIPSILSTYTASTDLPTWKSCWRKAMFI